MRTTLKVLIGQLASLQQQIGQLDRAIAAQHKASDVSQRLESIPGIGVIGATAISATIADPSAFKSGRDLAAWIGLVPRQHSTGGRQKLGGISTSRGTAIFGACSSSEQRPLSAALDFASGHDTARIGRKHDLHPTAN